MRRLLAVFLITGLVGACLPAPVAAQPGRQSDPEAFVLFQNPEHDRRLLVVGVGMVVGVLAYNYLATSVAPLVPTVASQLASAQAAVEWAGFQIAAAYTAVAGTVAGFTAVAAPAAIDAAAVEVATTTAAPAAVAAVSALPAAAAAAPGISQGVVNLAHMLGGAAAITGSVVAHYAYRITGLLIDGEG